MKARGRPRAQSTEALVSELVEGLEPVVPVRYGAAVSICLAAQAAALAIALWDPQLRVAATTRLESAWFLVAATTSLLGAATCAVAAVRSSLPGREPNAATLPLLTVPLMLAFAAVWVWRGEWAGLDDVLAGCRTCISGMMTTAVTPWFVMLFVLRRHAPLRPVRVGLLAGTAALLLGAVVTDVRCPAEDGIHLAVGHYLPVAAFSALGSAAAGVLLRRRDRSASPHRA
jgi:hypothetical protein